MNALGTTLRLSANWTSLVKLALLLSLATAVACVDFLTGERLSLYVVYAPIAAAFAWRFGLTAAIGFSLAAALVTLFDDYVTETPPDAAKYAAAMVRFLVFAGFAWLMVHLQQSRERLRRVAAHDALTGLTSRQELFVLGERELERARRENSNFAALFVDCDHFKAINDRWGHSLGDELLREVADSIRAVFGDTFIQARLGGDEFVVIAGAVDGVQLRQRAEQLQAHFARRMGERNCALTLSIGAALFRRAPATLDQVIATADELMYIVKQRARNGIEFRQFYADTQLRHSAADMPSLSH